MIFALLSVQGANRSGIVADISRVLHQQQINIADSSMTTLRSEFVMMLLLTLQANQPLQQLAKLFEPLEAAGLRVHLQEVSASEMSLPERPLQPSHAISVIGPDQTGIVYHVSAILAQHQVNILDLDSQLLDRSEQPIYAMILEVDASQANQADLKAELEAKAHELGIDLNFHTVDFAEI